MRPTIAIALLACLAALLASGCGNGDSATPEACVESPDVYVRALAATPGKVQLSGATPISKCLVENQDGGEIAAVGETMVEATTQLNAETRADPSGEAAVEIGYLIGAARRGADRTEGIHDELIRRLIAAARYSPGGEPLGLGFLYAYRSGFDAGRDHG